MVVMTEVFEVVTHVLRSIDIEEFSLSICDLKFVTFSLIKVFPEVSRHHWPVCLCIVSSEKSFINKGRS